MMKGVSNRSKMYTHETVYFVHDVAGLITYKLELASGTIDDHNDLKRLANEWLDRAGYADRIPDFWLNPEFRIRWSEYGIKNDLGWMHVPVLEFIVFEQTRVFIG